METKQLGIYHDEWYPVFVLLDKDEVGDGWELFDIPLPLYERWKQVSAEFDKVQDEIQEVENKARTAAKATGS